MTTSTEPRFVVERRHVSPRAHGAAAQWRMVIDSTSRSEALFELWRLIEAEGAEPAHMFRVSPLNGPARPLAAR